MPSRSGSTRWWRSDPWNVEPTYIDGITEYLDQAAGGMTEIVVACTEASPPRSDGDAIAASMSPDKGAALAALFTWKGWKSQWEMPTSTVYLAIITVRPTPAWRVRCSESEAHRPRTSWLMRFNSTSYSGWNERASVTLNGQNLRNDTDDYARSCRVSTSTDSELQLAP